MRACRPGEIAGAAVAVAAACVLGTCGRAGAVQPGIDLVITEIAPSDVNPPLSDPISVVVTVTNQGTEDVTGAYNVALFDDLATRPAGTDTPDAIEPGSFPLGVGQTTTVTFNNVGPPGSPETWSTRAYVDWGDGVVESISGENNNAAGPVTITWGGGAALPELKITAITPSASPATPTVPIAVTVNVENTGSADAVSFRLDIFRDLPVPPLIGDQSADNLTGLSLAAGTAQGFDFTGIASDVDATWQMYAIVDTVEAVAETNENNNIFGPENLVWGTAASLTVDSPNGLEAWEVGTVHNITWNSIGDVGTDVRIEYSPDGGASVWNEIVASTLNDGQYQWIVSDDPSTECLVRVSSTTTAYEDVSDGVFTIQAVTVSKPDLRILSMVPSSPNPTVGTPINVTVTVLNQGDADAKLFYVDLFKDRGSAPLVGESEGLKEPVNSLGAGLSTQVVFTGLTSSVVATWSMYSMVDTDEYIDESNEDNNVQGPVPVGWGGGVDAIAVTSPDGAEVLEAGEVHQITWSTEGSPGPPYHIEYSIDGGVSWYEVVGLTFNAASYDWIVPGAASRNCRVLVSNGTGTASDVSDDVFEIHTTSELVVLSISPSDANAFIGEEVSVAVVVENRGTADAADFAVALFTRATSEPAVGSAPDLSETVLSLAAGTQATVTFDSVTSAAPGVWTVHAIADNSEAVNEKDETNNVAGPAALEWHARPWLGAGCSPDLKSPGTSPGGASGFAVFVLVLLPRLVRRQPAAAVGPSS